MMGRNFPNFLEYAFTPRGLEEVFPIRTFLPAYIQESLDILGKACAGQPQLRVKIAVDCVAKGYATHEQVAGFVGLSVDAWREYYDNFREGDLRRIPKVIRNLVPARDLRYLTGFTDEQLNILVEWVLDHSLQDYWDNVLWLACQLWGYQAKQQAHTTP